MSTFWEQLTNILTQDNREELARALLEVLSTDQWLQTEIISKGHYIDRIYIKRSIHLKHSKKKTILPSQL